jgi:hypothetical protein
MTYDDERRSFEAYAERVATGFRRRYGVADDAAWADDQLERALADHDLPPLAVLPGEPTGMMVGMAHPSDTPERWRRVNASHLLGHVMLHAGRRCSACAGWGRGQ